MQSWKLGAGVLLVFVCGAALGALCMRFYIDYHFMRSMERPHLPFEEDILLRLDHAVGLTPEQKPQVLNVLKNLTAEMSSLNKEIEPRREEAFKRANLAVRSLLEDAQLPRFDAFIERVDKIRANHRQGFPPGPPHGGDFGPPGPPHDGDFGPPGPPPPGFMPGFSQGPPENRP